jgi:class 3 adenylate cyclase
MEPRIRYAKTSDGVSIGFCTLGEGPDLLVVPAIPYSHAQLEWQTWPEFYTKLAGDFRVTWYDARGSGVSNRDNIDFSIEAMLRDAEAVIRGANIGEMVLAGFSNGVLVAVTLASKQSARVTHLVLVDGYVEFADLVDSPSILAENLIKSNWDMYLDAATRVFGGYDDPSITEYKKMCVEREAFQAARTALRHWNVSSLLSEIRSPTLVFHPSDNRVVSVEAGQRLAAGIPGSRLMVEADRNYERLPDLIKDFVGVSARKGKPAHTAPTGTAIILFADIVDSTALTERLGDAAFRAKARDLDAALRTVIREHSGTPIEGKLLGDGVLAVFTSARQAIEAALACGRSGDDAGLPLHLGLHAGDVIREENNVYGGAVNIASRISGLSAPGEVLVSDTVRSLARTSAGVRFEGRGEQALKGVGEAVRVWAVREA